MSLQHRVRETRIRVRWEIGIVLALSLLPSAIYAIISLLETLALTSASGGIGSAQQAINPQTSTIPAADIARRVAATLFAFVPVALAIWLLWRRRETGFERLGLTVSKSKRFLRDLGSGVLLALAIGIPGLALYAASRVAGLTPQLVTSSTELAWWMVPLLLLAATRAALIEEVIVVGYLSTRLRTLGWTYVAILAASAVLRGSYHLYQGPAMALGNVAMGVVFTGWYLRAKRKDAHGDRARVLPLVLAHFLLDCVAFFGYPLAVSLWPGLF